MAAAMKMAVDGFLSAVVDGAAAKTVAYLRSNYDVPERAKELLSELETRLTMVKAISEVADNLLITNANLVRWLKSLQAAAQEAEDALDEFEASVASISGKRKVSELIESSLTSLKRLAVPDRGLRRLELVVKALTQLCASSGTFIELLKMDDFKSTQGQAGVVGEPSSHLPLDIHVFGRDEVRELILKVITGSSYHDHVGSHSGAGKSRANRPNILVLPIVGMSGVGKTTLAQVIYNHAMVKEQFQQRSWVYVADHFGLKRILQEILCSLNGYEGTGLGSGDTMEATITKLRSKLSGEHKFFLVLDNLWDEMCQEWSTLLTALSDEARQHGSVILVTTQSQRVARLVATMFPIDLKPLPWDTFWPLFRYHAFGAMEVGQQEAGNHHHSMLIIAKEIAKKLDGLPLAAKIIGNLLRRRFSRENWKRLADSDWWNLGEALQGILPYLRVSYQHLTPKQRQCFAFCSIFPRNCLFDKDRTVQMWVAHDFIHSNDVAAGGVMRLEDAGRLCFDELVDRSIFEPTIVSNKYVMHDSARGLAIAVSRHQCFFFHAERSEYSGGPSLSSSTGPENIRHLSLQAGSLDLALDQWQELHKYKNLRTLLLFGRFKSNAFFSLLDGVLRNSPGLRVLDLSHVEAEVNGWPTDARSLRTLRFLDLSFTRIAKLKDLPSNLQVLHLRGYGAGSMPQSITRLTNLCHLYVDDSALNMIQGIGQLTKLQELDSFIARKGQGFMLRELKNMRELTGRMCIRGVENVRSMEEAMEAILVEKKHLSALVIEGRKVPKFALEGLQPHPNIQELNIKFYQDQVFPHWMLQPDNLANLSKVNLESCRFLRTLPPVGHLPLLKLLGLRKLPSVEHVDGKSLGGFPSLEELEVQWVDQWVEWTEPDTDAADRPSSLILGCLQKLHLEYCQSLRHFPRFPYLSSLKELKVSKPGSYILALPGCPQVLACLKTLKIEYCHQSCVLSAHEFKSLESLEFIKCEGLRLADGFQCFDNLKSARVEGCPELLSLTANAASEGHGHERKQGANLLAHLTTDSSLMSGDYFSTMGFLPGLRSLWFSDMPMITHFSDKQELWFQQLTSLESLSIESCTSLQHLPTSLCALPSMKVLRLRGLDNLQSLPEYALPPNLQELRIRNCPEHLFLRVSKGGLDWPKVAHVPYIQVTRTHHLAERIELELTVVQNI